MNYLRWHYINIFAELAQSNTIEDIVSQIVGYPVHIPKYGDIHQDILNSNYAIC